MNDTCGGRWSIRPPDGEQSWVLIDIFPGEPGFEREKSEDWQAWGAALWLVLEICLSSMLPPWAAFGVSTMAYLGMEVAARAFGGRDRRLPALMQLSRARREVKAASMFVPGPSRDRKDC
jgi:hypothetical protein